MERNGLTEREKKYIEYWKIKQGSVIQKLWMVYFASLVVMVVVYVSLGGRAELPLLIGFFGFHVLAAMILLVRTGMDRKLVKSVCCGKPEVLRTRIVKKGTYDVKVHNRFQSKYQYDCYFCKGVSERVSPLSEKLYKMAEEGDEVTVVMMEKQNLFWGITFHEEYDKKILKKQ